MLIPDPNTCPPLGRPPSFKEFNAGLGDYALGLYAICAVVVSVLAILVRVKAKVFSGSNLNLILCGRGGSADVSERKVVWFFSLGN